jgi:hypothetical protein
LVGNSRSSPRAARLPEGRRGSDWRAYKSARRSNNRRLGDAPTPAPANDAPAPANDAPAPANDAPTPANDASASLPAAPSGIAPATLATSASAWGDDDGGSHGRCAGINRKRRRTDLG